LTPGVGVTIIVVMDTTAALMTRSGWTGDVSALAVEVAALHAEFGLAGEPPNVRLLRHYQQVGCIGRPNDRDGARVYYGYRHIVEALATRILLTDGWRLSKIGEAFARLEDAEIERLIAARGASLMASERVLQPSGEHGTAGSAVPEDRGAAALDLIAGFRKSAGLAPPSPSVTTATAPRTNRLPTTQKAQASPGRAVRVMREVSFAPWLRISVDEQALAQAEPGALERARAEAAAFLASIGR